jgi:hypothetical protein
MADERLKDENLEESYTEFGTNTGVTSGYYLPSGPIGRFFAKFFATKAQKHIDQRGATQEPQPISGDTVITTEVIKEPDPKLPATGGVQRNPILPQVELNRKRRNQEYEEMDQYPEIGAAFDIYADDATQKGSRNENWVISSKSELVVDEIENLFKKLKLDRILWDITRNTVKYGDCFAELIVNVNKEKEGVKKIKILNPNYILRVENEYGYLQKFLQEIPKTDTFNYGPAATDDPKQYIQLDKNQIIHFRMHTSDPAFYPYGKSVAALTHRVFRSLKMMEDAMMIYRLSRAPERRIFYVDVGALPTSKAEMYIERLKAKFKKEKFYNSNKGTVDSRYNPLSMDEDFFVPSKNGKGTKIETLPGATNLGEIEDVRYYRDKLLAALKVPKDYLVEKDKSPERKANLSQLDVKFARAVHRVQTNIEAGLENIAKRHLQLKGFPPSLISELRIDLPEPSDMSAKRKLDIDEQKTRVVQAVQQLGLFSKKQIYKEYFDMTDEMIVRLESELDKERQKQNQDAVEAAAQGVPAEEGAGAHQTDAEATPGPATESIFLLLRDRLDEDKLPVLQRILEKEKVEVCPVAE